jgi:hypothetical protein
MSELGYERQFWPVCNSPLYPPDADMEAEIDFGRVVPILLQKSLVI